MQTVTVLSKPACQQCTMTKNWLKRANVPFIEDDITTEMNTAAVRELGYQQAPVVLVSQGEAKDEQHWSGFQPDKLKEHVTVNPDSVTLTK